jgi:hypothetical protein
LPDSPTSGGRLNGCVRNLVDEAVVIDLRCAGGDAGPGGGECALDEPGRHRGGDPDAEAAAALVGCDLPGELRLPGKQTRHTRSEQIVQRRPEQERAVRVELGRDRKLEQPRPARTPRIAYARQNGACNERGERARDEGERDRQQLRDRVRDQSEAVREFLRRVAQEAHQQ